MQNCIKCASPFDCEETIMGYFFNRSTKKIERCDSTKCKGCYNTATNCTSCNNPQAWRIYDQSRSAACFDNGCSRSGNIVDNINKICYFCTPDCLGCPDEYCSSCTAPSCIRCKQGSNTYCELCKGDKFSKEGECVD
jgi:hypothetical protein